MQQVRYHISDITGIIHARRVSGRADDAGIAVLLTDSRHVTTADGCLFFALVSARNDGHKYIGELYRKGVRHFVVQYIPEEMKAETDVDFLLVDHTLDALQQLAAAYRRRFSISVVGVSGSNGKTIVKEWLGYLLSVDKKVVKSPKSYNSQVGVPLSVWEMHPDDELAIFEAGMSQAGEMERNRNVIQPTIGIFTNIGAAHDEHFASRAQKIDEKLALFTGVRQLIYCTDHTDIVRRIEANDAVNAATAFTWGRALESALRLTGITTGIDHTTLEAQYENETLRIQIPFRDNASIENAMHCWAFLLMLGYPQAVIAQRMYTLPPVEMRMELKEAVNNCSVINDSYSSDFNSLQIAVDFLARQEQHPKKTVILSDILQSGRADDYLYDDIARLLASKGVHRLVGIGQVFAAQAGKFGIEKEFYPDTDAFLRDFPLSSLHDETILLKGARVFAFEKIDKMLQQKAHETVMEINLNALAHNLNYYRSKLTPGVKLMAMVKAFSYGSGGFEIANLLQFHHADYLTVAYADEGVELRKAGITMPIMVMNPEAQSLDAMLRYNLEPEIYGFRILNLLKERIQYLPAHSRIGIHIKLDTGMHRLGFEEKDLPLLLRELSGAPALRVSSVFSHLATSDNPQFDAFTQQQITGFRRMSAQIQSACGYPVLRHILNSAGISRFPEAQFDMVRLGIGLYGIGVDENEQQQLQNVSTLKTVISQIKHIAAGETVGYNRSHTVERAAAIAVIPIGYADGLNRKFGNGRGHVWVNGKPAAVVGNVCMDMCMIDVSGIDAEENDEVIIFGDLQPVAKVAAVLDTIPYEVLTNVSRRVKRVYFQE
ncbi:MAG: bifunctional UDP-N-acetylmuramoyl-tripeptide:D-alanyl-D-alanine ligase/alanine racemase [Prevotellaceae bacterium]|jgi:alanine racemase|nr:bifunctional UDP-N-acetylmuramoyl-tripeptide:D-alanyl-D-alanine ligase/alanine racemase [Prevotellaceae bacterium]